MNTPGGFTVPRAASYPDAGEETARRNIGAKRLRAPRRGTQWFIPRDVPAIFANGHDPGTGRIRLLLQIPGSDAAATTFGTDNGE